MAKKRRTTSRRKTTRKRKPAKRRKSRSRRQKKSFSLTAFLTQKIVLIPLLIVAAFLFLFGSGFVSFSATGARLEIPDNWGNIFDFNLFEGVPEIGIQLLIISLVVFALILFVFVYMKLRGRFAPKSTFGQRYGRSVRPHDTAPERRDWLGGFLSDKDKKETRIDWHTPGRTRGKYATGENVGEIEQYKRKDSGKYERYRPY